jgi:hypothetical protein
LKKIDFNRNSLLHDLYAITLKAAAKQAELHWQWQPKWPFVANLP